MQCRIRTVLPYLQGRLVDIGCGTNELVKAYVAQGTGMGVGVDVHSWPNVDILVSDTSRLPFSDGEFDCATIIAALNHIPNREAVLGEVHRILKPEGLILVTMIPPGISRLWHRIRSPWDVDQSERGMKEGEVFGLTSGQVDHLLLKAGFKIRTKKRFMLGINQLTLASRE